MENSSILNRVDSFLEQYVGAFALAFMVMIVPITIYAVPMELPLAQAMLIGRSSTYDLYSASKGIVLFCFVAFLSIVFLKDVIQKRRKFKGSILIYIPFWLSLLNLIAVLLSDHKYQAVFGQYDRYEGFITQGLYVLVFVFASIYINQRNSYKILLKGLIVSSVVLSIIGILQGMGLNIFENSLFQSVYFGKALELGIEVHFSESPVAYAMLGNPNHVGSFTALVFPLFFASLWTVENEKKKMFLRGVLVLLWMFFLYSKSTGGYLGFIGGMLVFLYVGAKYANINIRKTLKELVLILSVGFIFAFILSSSTILSTNHMIFKSQSQSFYMNRIDFDEHDAVFRFNDTLVWKARVQNNQIEYFGNNDNPLEYQKLSQKIHFVNPDYQPFDHELIAHENAVELYFFNKQYSITTNGKAFSYSSGMRVYDDLNAIEHLPVEGMEKWGSGRLYIWSRTVPMLKKTLLVGNGPDTFLVHFPQHDLIGKINSFSNPKTIVDKPHNLYLMMGTTTGCLGLVLFLMFISLLIKRLLNGLKAFPERYDYLGIISALVSFLMVMLVNDSIIAVMVVFWCIIGTAVGLTINLGNKKIELKVNEVLK